MKDFYYILGVDPACSLDEIKGAYRKLSKKLHPDLNQGDEYFENKFRDVKEAFETLRDPLKRRLYDEELNKVKSGRPAAEPQKQQSSGRAYSQPSKAKPGKVRRRGPGVGLSITLIVITVIIGIYLFRWLTATSPKKQLVYTVAAVTPPVVHKKHRRKHPPRNTIADTAKIVVAKPDAMKLMPLKPQRLNQPAPVQPEPTRPMIAKARLDTSNSHSDYLYTTSVHPNVTGIVQLREHDRFNSTIIASIPANSRVFVLERGNTYYRVLYASSIGFVPKWSLKQK